MGDSQGICPAEEETQEGLKHVQAHGEHEGTALTQTYVCISLAFLLRCVLGHMEHMVSPWGEALSPSASMLAAGSGRLSHVISIVITVSKSSALHLQ